MEDSVRRISKKLEKVGLYGIYRAWKNLRPWAFKKDIWSELILWDQWGIFMDAKVFLDSPTDWIDWENDDFI